MMNDENTETLNVQKERTLKICEGVFPFLGLGFWLWGWGGVGWEEAGIMHLGGKTYGVRT